jgi:hypothetical protein
MKSTFPPRALLIAAVFYATLWLTYVVATSERAERRERAGGSFTMNAMYNRDYFIAKFEAIPAIKWTTGVMTNERGQHCVLGHCGEQDRQLNQTPESEALNELLDWDAHTINDGRDRRYQQRTPKKRILAALRDLPA